MTRKNKLQTLDTSIPYQSIGLDLAKSDVAVAAIPTESTEPLLVDRLDYKELYELAEKLEPTLFAMEPCCGYSMISTRLKNIGHQVEIISGLEVQSYVRNRLHNQKTDLNDAIALAHLANDFNIPDIRAKEIQELRIATIQTSRMQALQKANSILVSFKGSCQNWGIALPRATKSIKKLTEAVEKNAEMLGEQCVNALKKQIQEYKSLKKDVDEFDQSLKSLVEADSRGKKIQEVLGIGTQTTARLLTTIGDIRRFPNPRSFVAYYGCAPQNLITGHKGTPKVRAGDQAIVPVFNRGQGKIARNGDKLLRSLIMQCAACIYMFACKGQLVDCQLKAWLEKQVESRKPYGKIIVSLAAKLLRIVWALLTYDRKFDLNRAGVSRGALAALNKAQRTKEAATTAA